jgi:hypothetical protein
MVSALVVFFIVIIILIVIGVPLYFLFRKKPDTGSIGGSSTSFSDAADSSYLYQNSSSPTAVPPSSWTKLGDAACRNQNNEKTTKMYAQKPPYFNTTLEKCKEACTSNANPSRSGSNFCTGISFFELDQDEEDPIGNCNQLSESPWVSPNVNIGSEQCWYYGKGSPNGTAKYIVTSS